jgi:ADP-heptose:LPS heptosyltransferase
VAPRKTPPERYRYTRRTLRAVATVLDYLGTRAWRVYRRAFKGALARNTAGSRETVRAILLVQLDHLGDAVLTSALLPLLRRRFPEAALDVLASPWNRVIFETNPYVRRVVVSERNWFGRSRGQQGFVREAFVLGKQLRPYGYDLGIDVRGDLLVALLLWVAGVRRRLGSGAGGGAFLLTDCSPWIPDRHELTARLALLEPLGIAPAPNEVRPEVYPTVEHRQRVGSRLSGVRDVDRPLWVLHVGAGTDAKRWPIEHQRELIRLLHHGNRADATARRDSPSRVPSPHFSATRLGQPVCQANSRPQIILVGDRKEQALARRVAAGTGPPDVVDWTGRLELLELAALLERADLFVGADSGPAHLAAWARTPSVVLFSGTNHVNQWRPPSDAVTVMQHRTECSPCHLKRCVFSDHPCMTALTPELVGRVAHRVSNREREVAAR